MASIFERRFVFLSSEDKGYEIVIGKTPKGHIEIERKDNKLSLKVFVENLKEMVYQIQLFTLGGRYVVLDEISVGKGGKEEGEYSTSNIDVLNSGISWQEFDVIVVRPLGQEHSKKVPLVAWLNNAKGKKGQIPYIINENKHKLEEDEIKNVQEEQPEEDEQMVGEQQIETEEKSIEQQQEQDEYWVDFDEEMKEEIPKQEEEPEKELEINPEIDLEEPEIPYYYINQNIEKLQKTVPEIKPFEPPMKSHKWWKLMTDQKNLEGFYLYYNGSFVNLTYPYMGYRNIGEVYVDEYNHMIFGVVFDKKVEKKPNYYVYGIPGRLCVQDQPFQGNTGFLYWHPVEGNREEKGAMGYWLLYVGAYSGTIAIPKRPTIAPICDK